MTSVQNGSPTPALISGLLIAGLGYGIGLPSLIKIVIGGYGQPSCRTGLWHGDYRTANQCRACVAIIGGVFYSALGGHDDAHAFSTGLYCNIAVSLLTALLSLALGRTKTAIAAGATAACRN